MAKWTSKEVTEVYQLRSLLEGYAVRLAVRHISEDELACLGKLVDQMATAAATGDRGALGDLDVEFHRVLTEASRQSRLLHILPGISPRSASL